MFEETKFAKSKTISVCVRERDKKTNKKKPLRDELPMSRLETGERLGRRQANTSLSNDCWENGLWLKSRGEERSRGSFGS